MIDNSWLTEEYLLSLGYCSIEDDGVYGEYVNLHMKVSSPTYGSLPQNYRTLKFKRDDKMGVFLGVSSDWSTRWPIKNALAINKEVFEILLNAAV